MRIEQKREEWREEGSEKKKVRGGEIEKRQIWEENEDEDGEKKGNGIKEKGRLEDEEKLSIIHRHIVSSYETVISETLAFLSLFSREWHNVLQCIKLLRNIIYIANIIH